VIVDTSPSFSELGTNVLFYCSEAVVPVSMEVLATEGLVSFAEEVRHVQQYHDLAVRWILPTFVDGRTRKSAEILEALRGKYGDLVTLPVRYSSALSEASGWGKTIFEYRPRDRASADYAAIAGAVA
jgi:chromosome partitioning protein